MLYHFLILQLLLVCIKDSGGGEKKLIKMIIKKWRLMFVPLLNSQMYLMHTM